jgi:chromosome segregation ATPase
VQQRDNEIASLRNKLLRRSQVQESATEALLGRVSRLEADRAVAGSLSTEVARLKELQSVLSSEIDKVRQQLREAKESAENAKDIGLASRAVAEEAQKHVAEVQSEVETHRNALKEVRELVEGTQKKAASAEAQLGRVGWLEAEVSSLRTAPVVPALAVGPVASTRRPSKSCHKKAILEALNVMWEIFLIASERSGSNSGSTNEQNLGGAF